MKYLITFLLLTASTSVVAGNVQSLRTDNKGRLVVHTRGGSNVSTFNKWGEQIYNGTATSATDLITFSKLKAGKVYRAHIQIYSSSGAGRVELFENGVLVSDTNVESTDAAMGSSVLFTATGTDAILKWVSGTINGNGTKARTWMQIEETDMNDKTTDLN